MYIQTKFCVLWVIFILENSLEKEMQVICCNLWFTVDPGNSEFTLGFFFVCDSFSLIFLDNAKFVQKILFCNYGVFRTTYLYFIWKLNSRTSLNFKQWKVHNLKDKKKQDQVIFFLLWSSLKPGSTVYLDVDTLSGEAAEYRCDADLENGIKL